MRSMTKMTKMYIDFCLIGRIFLKKKENTDKYRNRCENRYSLLCKKVLGGFRMPKLTKREYLILGIALIAIFVIFYLNSKDQNASSFVFSSKDQDMKANFHLNGEPVDPSDKEEEKFIVVDVCGEVKNPGVIQLSAGSRVVDAVNLAGGLLETADRRQVNLARILNDGEQVYIPKIGEAANLSTTSGSRSGKININTASEEELKSLNGVGDALAKRIVEYREKNGFFKDIHEITNVSGIGEKKFESMKEQICVY